MTARTISCALALGAAGLVLAPAAAAAPSATFELIDVDDRAVGLADTVEPGSLTVTNTSDGGERIVAIVIDLTLRLVDGRPVGLVCPRTYRCDGPSLFQRLAFDPSGGVGDPPGRPLTLDGVTGTVALAGPAEYVKHIGEGFGAVTARFPSGAAPDAVPGDFEAGAQARFSFDVDPVSIAGAPAPAPAGRVSAAELHGATVTAYFSDGMALVNDLSLTPGKVNGARAVLAPGLSERLPAPVIARPLGAAARGATRLTEQTVQVFGPPGAEGTLVVAEGHRDAAGVPGGATESDPLEANTAVAIAEIPFTLGAQGFAAVPITLTDTAVEDPSMTEATGINHVTAHLHDGARAGPVSEPLVLRLDPSLEDDAPTVVHAGQLIEFSEAMDPGTVTWPLPPDGARIALGPSPTVSLRTADGAVEIPLIPHPDQDGRVFLLEFVESLSPGAPRVDLRPDTEYTLTISTQATDLAGNPLVEPAVRTFRTPPRPPPPPNPCSHCEPPPPPVPTDPAAPVCAGVPERPTNEDRGGIRLSAAQLLISQRIAQAAVRRANAVEAWLEAGIVAGDLCGNAFGPHEFRGVFFAGGGAHRPTGPTPRPLQVAPGGGGGDVALSAAQLLVNQRIAQAALRRVNALTERLDGNLTGGDLADGALGSGNLWTGLHAQSTTAATPVAKSRTVIGERAGEGGEVSVSVAQLRINQRISQAAVRRVNAIADRLARGLTGEGFRDGSLGFDDLAPDARHP